AGDVALEALCSPVLLQVDEISEHGRGHHQLTTGISDFREHLEEGGSPFLSGDMRESAVPRCCDGHTSVAIDTQDKVTDSITFVAFTAVHKSDGNRGRVEHTPQRAGHVPLA